MKKLRETRILSVENNTGSPTLYITHEGLKGSQVKHAGIDDTGNLIVVCVPRKESQ